MLLAWSFCLKSYTLSDSLHPDHWKFFVLRKNRGPQAPPPYLPIVSSPSSDSSFPPCFKGFLRVFGVKISFLNLPLTFSGPAARELGHAHPE
jgi:hypothetical protein